MSQNFSTGEAARHQYARTRRETSQAEIILSATGLLEFDGQPEVGRFYLGAWPVQDFNDRECRRWRYQRSREVLVKAPSSLEGRKLTRFIAVSGVEAISVDDVSVRAILSGDFSFSAPALRFSFVPIQFGVDHLDLLGYRAYSIKL